MNRMLRRIVILSMVGASFVAGQALADSASLQSALQHLQAARNDLESGSRKGDDAKQALLQVEQAIDHVRRGIQHEKKREEQAARDAERKQERAVQQEQRNQEKAVQDEERAQQRAAEQAKKSQKKPPQQGQTDTTQ